MACTVELVFHLLDHALAQRTGLSLREPVPQAGEIETVVATRQSRRPLGDGIKTDDAYCGVGRNGTQSDNLAGWLL